MEEEFLYFNDPRIIKLGGNTSLDSWFTILKMKKRQRAGKIKAKNDGFRNGQLKYVTKKEMTKVRDHIKAKIDGRDYRYDPLQLAKAENILKLFGANNDSQ